MEGFCGKRNCTAVHGNETLLIPHKVLKEVADAIWEEGQSQAAKLRESTKGMRVSADDPIMRMVIK